MYNSQEQRCQFQEFYYAGNDSFRFIISILGTLKKSKAKAYVDIVIGKILKD
jgi:hypothetical protein